MVTGIVKTVCFLTCLNLVGCASQDLMVKRQAEAEAKIEYLIQAEKKTNQRLNELTSRLQSQEEITRADASRIEQLQAKIAELRTAPAENPPVAVQSAVPKIEIVNQAAPARATETGPPAEYVKAFGLYSANNFSAAITAFQTFLAHSPKSDYVPNALYWIGECHYSMSDLPQSMANFKKVVDNYPGSPKAPDALLKLGYAQAAMQDRGGSVKTFENLIKRYPSSQAAGKARERLTAN